jgi:hypothetical protein
MYFYCSYIVCHLFIRMSYDMIHCIVYGIAYDMLYPLLAVQAGHRTVIFCSRQLYVRYVLPGPVQIASELLPRSKV